jgi:hypothetical protein
MPANRSTTAAFAPFYLTYLETLAQHLQCSSSLPDMLDPFSELADFREEVIRLLDETIFIVESEVLVGHLWQRCVEAGTSSWTALEAHFYLICVSVRNMPVADAVLVPAMLQVRGRLKGIFSAIN